MTCVAAVPDLMIPRSSPLRETLFQGPIHKATGLTALTIRIPAMLAACSSSRLGYPVISNAVLSLVNPILMEKG